MAEISKIKGYSVGRLFQHHNRTWDDGVNHSNENIDLERTPLNVHMKDGEATNVTKRIKSLYHMEKKNLTVLEEAIVTLPQDVMEEDTMAFFNSVYNFYDKDFEIENAVVHFDEVTPHIHIDFYPILKLDRELLKETRPAYLKRIENYEQKNGVVCDGILNGKEVINRKFLQNMHPALLKWVTEDLGYPCEILNGATENGNKTVLKLKNEALEKQVNTLQNEKETLEKTLAMLDVSSFDKRYCNYQQLLATINVLTKINDMYSDLIYENCLDLTDEQEKQIRELKSSIPQSKINVVRIGKYEKPLEDVIEVVPIKMFGDKIQNQSLAILKQFDISEEFVIETPHFCKKIEDKILFVASNKLDELVSNLPVLIEEINSCSEKNIIIPSLTRNDIEINFLENISDDKNIFIEKALYFNFGDRDFDLIKNQNIIE